jgi:hypothetical protein
MRCFEVLRRPLHEAPRAVKDFSIGSMIATAALAKFQQRLVSAG